MTGATTTPSGRLYAYSDSPHTTHRKDGRAAPRDARYSVVPMRFSAAPSTWLKPTLISNAPHLPSSSSSTASISLSVSL